MRESRFASVSAWASVWSAMELGHTNRRGNDADVRISRESDDLDPAALTRRDGDNSQPALSPMFDPGGSADDLWTESAELQSRS